MSWHNTFLLMACRFSIELIYKLWYPASLISFVFALSLVCITKLNCLIWIVLIALANSSTMSPQWGWPTGNSLLSSCHLSAHKNCRGQKDFLFCFHFFINQCRFNRRRKGLFTFPCSWHSVVKELVQHITRKISFVICFNSPRSPKLLKALCIPCTS